MSDKSIEYFSSFLYHFEETRATKKWQNIMRIILIKIFFFVVDFFTIPNRKLLFQTENVICKRKERSIGKTKCQ